MKNTTEIKELDYRQCEYYNYHGDDYTTGLIINGLTDQQRLDRDYPLIETKKEEYQKVASHHPNHKAYLWRNVRGDCVVWRTTANENMFIWGNMPEIKLEVKK